MHTIVKVYAIENELIYSNIIFLINRSFVNFFNWSRKCVGVRA